MQTQLSRHIHACIYRDTHIYIQDTDTYTYMCILR